MSSLRAVGTVPPAAAAADGGGGASDPLFDKVELLLMPVEGESEIIDKSSNGRTVTNTDVVIVTDAESPTGVSMDFGSGGNNRLLTFSEDSGLKPGTGAFCMECIVQPDTGTTLGCLTGTTISGGTGGSWQFPWFYTSGNGPYAYPGGSQMPCNDTNVTSSRSGVTWHAGAYNHWAFTRSGITTKTWCNGREETSYGSATENVGASPWDSFHLGMWAPPSTRVFGGKVAFFRITIGDPRYTADFGAFGIVPALVSLTP